MPAMKITGKPYAGKLHVRFDEGEGEYYFTLPSLLYWFKILPLHMEISAFKTFQ